jgi:hypothetical protein
METNMNDVYDAQMYGTPLRVTSERSQFYMGVDIGQKRDHTAMAIVERAQTMFAGRDPVTYAPLERVEFRLRMLRRLPLGLPYVSEDGEPSIVNRVAATMRKLKSQYGGLHGWRMGQSITMVVDATGVGTPVVDQLRKEQLGCDIVPVTITAGSHPTQTRDGWFVPKRDLVTGLQVMYEGGRLRMARGMKLTATLMEELAGMESRTSETGKERYSAWREGARDDLVLAVALAVWRAKLGEKSPWGKVRLV